ncbi:hypothetical protein R1flu_023356 [Riccia fluitans]|uniref:BUD13 homolog n=1 Tax=Riccia fluitans TaxID=41844 RepID=A0ABD1XRT7_9MARC
MSTSMQEYLKRYNATTTTRGDDEVKAKPKKKKVKGSLSKSRRRGTGVVIIDNDGVWQKERVPEEEEEFDEADKPTVVEDVDVKVMHRMEALKSYRPYLSVANDGSGWVTVKGDAEEAREAGDGNLGSSPPRRHDSPDISPSRRRRDEDLSFVREKVRSRNEDGDVWSRHDSPDLSPPRKRATNANNEGGDITPPRSKNVDISPPRRRKVTGDDIPARRRYSPDISLPRQRRDADLSPPRRNESRDLSSPRRKIDADLSPPRKNELRDIFPPRRKRDADLSPPRRQDTRDTLSPKRKRDADLSPPRRHDTRDTLSPTRKRDSDLSPPRKRAVSRLDNGENPRKRHDSPDVSPPRRRKETELSPPRKKATGKNDPVVGSKRRKGDSGDLFPPRKRHDSPDFSPSRGDESNKNRGGDESRNSRKHKMADGSAGGLRTDKQVAEEIRRKKAMELKALQELDPSASGRGAETVYRDKRGRRLEGLEEFLRQQKGEAKPPEKPLEWGKGLAQKRELEAKFAELEAERNKPFARTRDDPDLDRDLKERMRWGDPMAHLVKKKMPELDLPDLGATDEMKASGFIIPQEIPPHSWLRRGAAPAPNRYGIKPGRHWDGVDRSTGYERELFKSKNEKQALQREAYLWSATYTRTSAYNSACKGQIIIFTLPDHVRISGYSCSILWSDMRSTNSERPNEADIPTEI